MGNPNPEQDDRTGAIDETLREEAENAASSGGRGGSGADDAGQDDATRLRSELAAEQDRTLRLRAEIENVRARSARELSDVQKYAAVPVARDLLPVLDNVDRAIAAAEREADVVSLLEGFRMVRQQLLTVLEQQHCVPIQADGEPFDPQFHEAILQQPSQDVPPNHVLQVVQQGYRMHDRVVRASQVIVSSGSASGAAPGSSASAHAEE